MDREKWIKRWSQTASFCDRVAVRPIKRDVRDTANHFRPAG